MSVGPSNPTIRIEFVTATSKRWKSVSLRVIGRTALVYPEVYRCVVRRWWLCIWCRFMWCLLMDRQCIRQDALPRWWRVIATCCLMRVVVPAAVPSAADAMGDRVRLVPNRAAATSVN